MQLTKKILFSGIIFLFSLPLFSQKITTIKGIAPDYVGKTIQVMAIEDYISLKEQQLAITTVKADSTFSMSFMNDTIQKVVIRSNNNFSYIYIEPGKTYDIYLPLHDKDKPYRPLGNYVNSVFLNLDTNDINNRIIKFNFEVDRLFANNVYNFVRDKQKFLDTLKAFKDSVFKSIQNEPVFYRAFIFYSFADMDMSLYTNSRANEFIYNQYINRYPILYSNEFYMSIIKKLYDRIFTQLDLETSNKAYLAVLKKSPTLLEKALEHYRFLAPDYVQKGKSVVLVNDNAQLRELVTINGLIDAYDGPDFPKTNILAILDSISRFPKFKENGLIARNVIERLTAINPGNEAPDFALTTKSGKLLTLKSFHGKYIYFHLFRPDFSNNIADIELLEEIYNRYKDLVDFVSIYPKDVKMSNRVEKVVNAIPWEVVALDPDDKFFKDYQVKTFPYYILIDRTGTVVGAPALGPQPNGEYQTIDKVFYDIRRMDKVIEEREKENRNR